MLQKNGEPWKQRKIPVIIRRKPKSHEPSAEFIRRNVFSDAKSGPNMSSDLGRAFLGKTRNDSAKVGLSKDGIVSIAGTDFAPMVEKIRNKCGTDEQLLKSCFGEDLPNKVYIGLTTFFIPAVYYWGMLRNPSDWKNFGTARQVEELLGRMEDAGHLLSRRFRQFKYFKNKESGREMDISAREYVDLLKLDYLRAKKDYCVICEEDKKELLTTHHIIGKGAFRHIWSDVKLELLLPENAGLKERGKGDFGKNQVEICKRCHQNSIERVINNHMVQSSKKEERSTIWVADLHILLAKKVAQFKLLRLNYENPEIYQKIVASEMDFLLAYSAHYGEKADRNGNGNGHWNGICPEKFS